MTTQPAHPPLPVGDADLALAIAQAAHDEASGRLVELLAWREALGEAADPGRRLWRLIAAAEALDLRAEDHARRAAEYFGKEAWRRGQGEADLAAEFGRRAEAAEAVAAAQRGEAFDLRLAAARLAARLNPTSVLTGLPKRA